MIRTIGFKENIMGNHIMEEVIAILPILAEHFEDHKTHGDVVFTGNNISVILDLRDLESLTENFSIRMDDDFIEVEV